MWSLLICFETVFVVNFSGILKGQVTAQQGTQEKEQQLAKDCISKQVCEKGVRNHPLTEEQKISNRSEPKMRSRVEHVLAAQAQMGGHTVNTIGILRAEVKIGMVRLGQLIKRNRINVPV